MKSIIAAVAMAVACVLSAGAQSRIMGFREMKDFVLEKPEAYRGLVDRLVKADTTLSLNDLRILYYSPAFAADYDGGYSGEPDYVAVFAKGREFYLKAYDLCRSYLAEHPVSLRAAYDAWNLGRIAGRPQHEIAPYARRFAALVRAVTSSGDGSMDSPMCIVDIADQDVVMKQVLGVGNVLGQEYTYNKAGSTCNRVKFDKCDPEKFGGDEVVFDVTLPVAAMTKMMSGQ